MALVLLQVNATSFRDTFFFFFSITKNEALRFLY